MGHSSGPSPISLQLGRRSERTPLRPYSELKIAPSWLQVPPFLEALSCFQWPLRCLRERQMPPRASKMPPRASKMLPRASRCTQEPPRCLREPGSQSPVPCAACRQSKAQYAAMQVFNYTMQHAGEVICSMPPCRLEASPCAACQPNMESCNHPAFHCAAFPALN